MEPHDAQIERIFYTAKDRRLCVTSGKCSLIDLTKWFWVCRQSGVFGGLFYTGIIWLVEVGALLLLIRTAEKYKTKSYQVSLPFPLSPWLMELRKRDTFAGIISMEFCELKNSLSVHKKFKSFSYNYYRDVQFARSKCLG